MLLVIVATISAAAIACFALPRQYTATSSVLVDVKSPDPIAGAVLPGMMTASYMATQVSVLQSERVALMVIRALKMTESPAMRARWIDDTSGQGSFESWLADLLGKGLKVEPAREANVIDISYRATDPDFAATLVNAYVKAFISTTIEMRVEPAKEYNELFVNQTTRLKQRLEQAQARLSEYQKQTGLLATDERIDVETARLAELSTQLVALQALTSDSTSRQGVSAGNLDRLQDVMNSPLITSLRTDLARLEAQQRQLSDRYGENHPSLTEIRANITELRSRLDQEVKRIGGSLSVNSSVLRNREAQLRDALEQQRNKLLKLKEQRDYASILTREVDGSQRALEDIEARFNRTNLESQTRQTNLQVIKTATPPGNPSSPKVVLDMVLAVVLGLVLSLVTAFALEFMDRRIRSTEDVVELLSSPVLGVIPHCDLRESSAQPKMRLPFSQANQAKLPGIST